MINEKYSYKDFSCKSFKDIDVSEFNNSIIIGSCFYGNNSQMNDLFPDGVTGIEFQKCNLDNVLIPENCTTSECSHRFIKLIDNVYWVCDINGNPIERL